MPTALEALSALSLGSHSYVRDARVILAQARVVEHAAIAERLGHNLVCEAMRENDPRFARMVVVKLDLGLAASHGDIVSWGIAEYGDAALDVLEMLISSKRPAFSVRALDSRGCPPLFSACQYGCLGVVKMLIAHGAQLNFSSSLENYFEDCAVTVAVTGTQTECLREVLTRGANPYLLLKSSPSETGLESVLSEACGLRNPAGVAYVLRALASRDAYESHDLGNALSWAASLDRTSVEADMLINAGASFRFQGSRKDVNTPTPFFFAALEGNDRVARYMLRRLGSEVVNAEPDHSLWWHHASRHGPTDERRALCYLRLLLRLGFSLTQEWYQAAWSIARYYDSAEISKLLVRCWPVVESNSPQSGALADELSFAIEQGKRACAKTLVDHGALLGEMTSTEVKSLAVTMWKDDAELYGKLVRAGAKLNYEPGQDWSVIGQYLLQFQWYARSIAFSPTESISFDLFKHVARSGNIDKLRCDAAGNKALHLASQEGLSAHVDFLLEEMNADVNIRNGMGDTPLMFAACTGNYDVVSRLVRVPALDLTVCFTRVRMLTNDMCRFFARPGVDAFLLAAVCGRSEILQLLAEHGANVHICDDHGRNAVWHSLHDAAFAAREYVERVVDMLLTFGVSVDSVDTVTGARCTHVAARHGVIGAVRLFRLNGMDLNTRDFDGNTTLHWTVNSSTASSSFIVELVRELGADVDAENAEGETALHVAVRHGAVHDVEALIEVGANVDAVDARGCTPLMAACSIVNRGKARRRWDATAAVWRSERPSPLSTVHALLRAGADASRASSRGLQALHYAAASDQAGVCRLLAVHLSRAQLSVRSESGLTPLHFACRRGHAAAAELLLDAGAKPNERDDRGRTPLYHAAAKGRMACVSTLLARGADASLRCSAQLLPADVSKRRGHASVAGALLQHAEGVVRNEGAVSARDNGASCSSSTGADVDSNIVGGEGFWAGLSF